MKPMGEAQRLETLWEIPDHLWEKIEPVLLEGDPPKASGRKRVNPRQILDGIIFGLCSSCPPITSECPDGIGAMTAPSIAPSSGGWNWVCSSRYGRCW